MMVRNFRRDGPEDGKSKTCKTRARTFLKGWFNDHLLKATTDGRNPAPPRIYRNPVNNGINCLSTVAGFHPSTVSFLKTSCLTLMFHFNGRQGLCWAFSRRGAER